MTRRGLTPDEALAAAVGHHALAKNDSSPMSIADAVVGLHNTMPMGPYLSFAPEPAASSGPSSTS